MKTVGITGGIASGKSLVSSILINHGYTVIDCDKIAHEIITLPSVIDEIVNFFGLNVLENKQINRKILGEIIFHDPTKQAMLNHIIHPQVIKEVRHQLSNHQNEEIVFVDVPLLYEAKMETMMDKVIVVYIKQDIQLSRLMNRDQISEDLALRKINSQLSIEEKAQLADFVVNNNNDILDTQAQLLKIIRRIKDEI